MWNWHRHWLPDIWPNSWPDTRNPNACCTWYSAGCLIKKNPDIRLDIKSVTYLNWYPVDTEIYIRLDVIDKKGRISGKALVIIAFPGGGVFVSHSFVLQAYNRVISKRKAYWIEILIFYNTFVSLLCFIQCFCFNLQHVLQVHFHL